MSPKVSLIIEIILHATEDLSKIEKSLQNIFDISLDGFEKEEMTGHFGNPITILKANISKNNAKKLISILISKISNDDLETLQHELDEMDKNSGLQIRISKQDLIRGKISFAKSNSVKLTITTPVYKKNEIGRVYREILNIR
tara:strand:- start:61 stop:486 length:426 start_codon:yes stop_codon:yes gene_type:complete